MSTILGWAHALVRRILLVQVAIFQSFFSVDGDGGGLRRLLDTTVVEAPVEDFALVAEVARAGLIGLGGLRVILTNFVDLWLIQTLLPRIDTLEIKTWSDVAD